MFWLPHKREEIQTLVFDKTNDINKTYSSRQNTRKQNCKSAFLLVEASHIGEVIRVGENHGNIITT